MANNEPQVRATSDPEHVANEIKRAIRTLGSDKPLSPKAMRTLSILGRLVAPPRESQADPLAHRD
jgi:hypothetical protein